jgi:hypothetical protein
MTATNLLSLILICISTAAGWTRTDHWQTTVITTYKGSLYTSSIAVYPTASASATSTNTSTTLVSDDAPGAWLVSFHTYPITVTDLFYPPDAPVCTDGGFKECSPTPTYTISGSITTSYYAPVVIRNPSSCTKTSFLYTTQQAVWPPGEYLSIPDAVDQATGSAEALFVTTYVSTLSTNLGGQAVTTSVCDVYLKQDAVLGVSPGYEAGPLSQCVDPRVYSCVASNAETSRVTCQTTGQTYPPTGQAAGAGSSAASSTKTGGADGLTFSASKIWVLFTFPGCVVLFSLLY